MVQATRAIVGGVGAVVVVVFGTGLWLTMQNMNAPAPTPAVPDSPKRPASPECATCERDRVSCLAWVRSGHLVDGTEAFADPFKASLDGCAMTAMGCFYENKCPR